jgi:hypothetical protein
LGCDGVQGWIGGGGRREVVPAMGGSALVLRQGREMAVGCGTRWGAVGATYSRSKAVRQSKFRARGAPAMVVREGLAWTSAGGTRGQSGVVGCDPSCRATWLWPRRGEGAAT